uniref:Sphere organelles family protein n=1 Tax=Rhizophora mucronata TaxID=61149 RepID=A0A2P2N0L3_RHIMU
MPVPEYPVTPLKVDDEESTILPESSLYGEDGSLEIDFISLLEVRIVKLNGLNSAKSVDGTNEIHARDEDAITDVSCPNNNNKSHTSARENGEFNPWEENNKALDAKKAQLSEEDDWGRVEVSVRRPWSYKALRGSALGPTMALLRSQNGP